MDPKREKQNADNLQLICSYLFPTNGFISYTPAKNYLLNKIFEKYSTTQR